MIPDDVLIELVGYACEPWGSSGWYRAAAPTSASLERISRELGIRVPALFAYLASHCPVYGGWFASIGEDYDSPVHIMKLNWAFRDLGLPAHLVMLNHGHDGDCDCWDLTQTHEGEHPIVYVRVEQRDSARVGALQGTSFREYLERYCRQHATRTPVRALRRRAKRILEQYGEEP
jgi:hypothetical protein